MPNLKNRLFLVSTLAVLALLGGVIYYLNQPVKLPELAPEPVVASAPQPAKAVSEPSAREGIMETVMTEPKTFFGASKDPDEFSSNPKRDPEEQAILDLAIDRKLSDTQKVERMLGMIPTLPPDAQTLAMENATALIPDESYVAYRGRLLSLAKTPDMRVAVMNDSLTRGEEVRLPNLLEMMRTSSDEAEKTEIRYILEAYLDKDYGPQPGPWEGPLREWVKANTDQ